MSNKTIILIASGLGTGYSPVASGTAGSLLGLLVAFLFAYMSGGGPGVLGSGWYLLMAGALLAVGVWAAGRAEEIYGQKDCGKIVIDEVVGMLLTLYLLPPTWLYFVLGFFLFRFFDIIKPFPARRIDMNVKGGLGVMFDDVAAAVYANLCLQLVRVALA
jgi:phosphatidylglycerophosphatase A